MSSHAAVLSVVGIALTAGVAFAQAPVGWTYTMNMTTDSGGTAKRSSMATRYSAIPGKVRTEFVQVSNNPSASMIEGAYQVLNAADTTVTMIMPQQHSAMIMSIGSALSKMGPTKYESHVTQSHVEDLGVGERILGHPTRHVRVTSAGTLDITIGGESCTASLNSTSEMWIAPDVDLREMFESYSRVYRSIIDQEPEVSADASSTLPHGTALRTITRKPGVTADGRPTTVTTTMEFVELTHGPIDPVQFAPPPGMQVMDMRAMMKDIPADALDAAMAKAKQSGGASASHICKALGGQP